jgi:hypothetical protein
LTNLPEEINHETLESIVKSHIGPNDKIELIHIEDRIRIAILHLNSKEAKESLLKKGNIVVVSRFHQIEKKKYRSEVPLQIFVD